MAIPKARWRRFVLPCVCLIATTLVGFRAIDAHRRQTREEKAVANLLAAGVPTNVDELNAFCELPDDVHDETELWKAIFDLRRQIDAELFEKVDTQAVDGLPIVWENEQGYTIPPPGVEWGRSDQCTKYLDHFGEVFHQSRMLHESTGAIHSTITVDFDDDEFNSFSDEYRHLSELLLLDSHHQARLGNPDIALANLRAVYSMIHAGRFEAEYNGVMALQRAHRLASTTAIRLASQCNWSDRDLSALQAAIARPDFRRYTQRS
jgi:hypothetical protein